MLPRPLARIAIYSLRAFAQALRGLFWKTRVPPVNSQSKPRPPAPAPLVSALPGADLVRRLWPALNQRPFQRAPNLGAPVFLAFKGARLSSSRSATRVAAELALTQYKKSFFRATFSGLTPQTSRPFMTPRAAPFLELTTPLTLAAAEVAPAYRHASIARSLTSQAIRRALILIHPLPLRLILRGAMPGFASLWKQLNSPLGEYYPNPLAPGWICDIGLSANSRQAVPVRFKVSMGTAVNLSSDDAAALSLDTALEETLQAFQRKAAVAPAGRLKRYSFHWAEVLALLQTPHGYVKRKRARSIKKRLAKRLTSLAQRRYWVL